MTTNIVHTPDGKSTFFQLDAETSSWTASASKSVSSCLEHLPWLSGKGDSPTHISTHWLEAQSDVPYHLKCGAYLPVIGQTEFHERRRQQD